MNNKPNNPYWVKAAEEMRIALIKCGKSPKEAERMVSEGWDLTLPTPETFSAAVTEFDKRAKEVREFLQPMADDTGKVIADIIRLIAHALWCDVSGRHLTAAVTWHSVKLVAERFERKHTRMCDRSEGKGTVR